MTRNKRTSLLKKYFGFLGQKMFLLFVALATILLFINKLNGTYITEIRVPILLTADYATDVWVENPHIEVTATVQARGSRLLAYRMGMGGQIILPVNMMAIAQKSTHGSEQYTHMIDPQSLAAALGRVQNEFTILQINSTDISVRLSPIVSANIWIDPRIEVSCQRQYMQVGEIKLSQDSLAVKAPQAILDTLKSIPTQTLKLHGLHKPTRGMIDLLVPEGVMAAHDKIEYQIDVTGYTEIEFMLPVMVEHLPDSLRYLIVPSEVLVLTHVPLRSLGYIGTMREPVATVKYQDLATNLGRTLRVQVDSLSYGMQVRSITPSYVEPFFQVVQ